MTFSLPKRTLTLWQIRISLIFILLCAVVAFLSRYSIWFLLTLTVVVLVAAVTIFIYIPFYFKSYKITVAEGSIIINKGLIIKTTNIMPFPRLVFAESFTTPLASFMKLKGVMLKAARGWMLVPEIENKNADFLLDNLRICPNDKNDL